MSDVRLFCSDLDGTLLGNPESTSRFRLAWEAIAGDRPCLCYNTGRLVDDTLAVVDTCGLPKPDFILGGVGTQIWDASRGGPLPGFAERFAQGWDSSLIERTLETLPGVVRQPPEFLHPYKSSWYWHGATKEAIDTIEEQLRSLGLDVVVVCSGQRYLAVLPRHASKGKALTWLAKHLGIPPAAIVVAGDSGNDSGMFRLPGIRGILVENAQPDLLEATVGRDVYTANGIIAEGVLDGLKHFGVIQALPARPLPKLGRRLGLRELACRELVRLAELNRSGVRSEWEFNEWAHALTGRPMGKRYQAWAAASYLRACHELELVVDETGHD